MLLAGGQGSRLGVLTSNMAKPAVPFGGKYRIIDFPLSNCANSGIDTVGVLTQYQPLELNAYIGSGAPWDLDVSNGGVYVLPPYHTGKTGEWYRGTANAIYQNLAFIEQFNPDYVLILSGDHIYKMDYNAMLRHHIQKNADVTIVISDNETTAMTGGQDSAGTGRLEAICAGIGVAPEHIRVVVPLKKNYEEMKQIIREEIEYHGVSVIIPRRECIQTLARKKRNK